MKSFHPKDILEVMRFVGPTTKLEVGFVKTLSGVSLDRSKPGSVVKIPYIEGAEKFNIIRKATNKMVNG